MSDDELELDTLGDRKTALFLIMSDTDTTFNFVIAMLQSQLFNLLCDKADDMYGGRLPVHVRCLLDEFANIGQIPNFDKLIATIRSREISASIILQSQSQLKTIYKDAADTIVGNCDTTLFLGGKEKSTLKEISELLGKETIDSFNQSENRGSQVSHGLNYQKLGKELMTQDEIAVMDGGKCILQLRGVRPFFSDKFDITKHPRYKYLADADKKNTFDIERYRSDKVLLGDLADRKYSKWYPLMEWGWTRDDCIRQIEAAGLPQPGKSSCFFCPSMKPDEITALREQHPDLFRRALALEDNARKNLKTVKGLGRNYSWRERFGKEFCTHGNG